MSDEPWKFFGNSNADIKQALSNGERDNFF